LSDDNTEDYDWNWNDWNGASPHEDENGPMQGGPWHDYPRDNDSKEVVAVLMNDYQVGLPILKVEDVDWDNEEDREELVRHYNEHMKIHMRVPIAVFSSKEQYDTWRNKYLGDSKMPENWYTEMRISLNNGPAIFDCQVPDLGEVKSIEDAFEKFEKFIDFQERER